MGNSRAVLTAPCVGLFVGALLCGSVLYAQQRDAPAAAQPPFAEGLAPFDIIDTPGSTQIEAHSRK